MKNKFLLLLLFLLIVDSCAKSPQNARKELHALGIDFKTDVYEDHVEESDFVVVKLFLDAKMPPNSEDALVTAIEEQNYDMVKLLLKYGADPNSYGVLLEAIGEGNLEIVELLIKNGVELNKIHERKFGYKTQKYLPIAFALDWEELEIAKLIVNNGGTLYGWKQGDKSLEDIYATDELKVKDYDLWFDLIYHNK